MQTLINLFAAIEKNPEVIKSAERNQITAIIDGKEIIVSRIASFEGNRMAVSVNRHPIYGYSYSYLRESDIAVINEFFTKAGDLHWNQQRKEEKEVNKWFNENFIHL